MSKNKKLEQKKLKRRSLSSKLIRMISAILVFVMVVIIFATYKGLDYVYLAFAAVRAFSAEIEIEELFTGNNSENFIIDMDTIEREYEVNIEIFTKNNDFVYSTSYKGAMSSPPYTSELILIPDSERKIYEDVMDLGETTYNSFRLCQDTSGTKNTVYIEGTWKTDSGMTIKIYKVKTTVDISTRIAVIFISVVAMIVLAAAFILITIYVHQLTKPLSDMSVITKNMSNLDFSKKCEPNTITELSVLSDSINEMSDSLENALVDLRQKNKKLEDDIEQEKTIDTLRKVFISGVSHELKTPIAIIQGYSEGLKVFLETDPEMAEKYCDIIISETERMNNLVMKLLEIIKYESGEYNLLSESFNLRETIDSWFTRNSELLKEKGITAENNIDENFIAFGDTFIIPTVVNNYISNAVSHVSGKMVIRADAKLISNDRYRVSIFNTGAPIASKDIDHIWDSFYRADKAMSRAQGRFGLGLAIVAAIQNLHGQKYGVKNHDNGVEFWFDVKKFESQDQ